LLGMIKRQITAKEYFYESFCFATTTVENNSNSSKH
jgi:hypothetical protein